MMFFYVNKKHTRSLHNFLIRGHFSIRPIYYERTKQQYLPNSNILSTRFLSAEGASEIIDYMHILDKRARSLHKQLLPWLIRSVEAIRGKVSLRVELFPAFNYARDKHTTRFESCPGVDDVRVIFNSKGLSLDLRYLVEAGEYEPPSITWTKVTRDRDLGPGVIAEFTLQEGQCVKFILREIVEESDEQPPATKTSKKYPDPPLSIALLNSLYRQTLKFWQNWISQSSYNGRWREHVHRSALALKLMTYEPVSEKTRMNWGVSGRNEPCICDEMLERIYLFFCCNTILILIM